jgi:hypothetical protein
MITSAASSRRKHAVESFGSAQDCIGRVEKNMSLFAITRGQFSMLDDKRLTFKHLTGKTQ